MRHNNPWYLLKQALDSKANYIADPSDKNLQILLMDWMIMIDDIKSLTEIAVFENDILCFELGAKSK